VWEWTADTPPADPGDPADLADPATPAPCHPRAEALVELAALVEPPDGDPAPGPVFDTDVNIGTRALKGGSFLCGPGHCAHLRPSARVAMPTGISAGHIGFRCVARAAPVTPEG
jgi:formylglycine-generating enzyme required for sulfatase activity